MRRRSIGRYTALMSNWVGLLLAFFRSRAPAAQRAVGEPSDRPWRNADPSRQLHSSQLASVCRDAAAVAWANVCSKSYKRRAV